MVMKSELFSIFYASEKFHAYLLGMLVIVRIDHATLCYLMAKKK